MRKDAPTPNLYRVALAEKQLAAYAPIVGDEMIAEIEALAEPLRGARVAHISSAHHGGGVAEVLHTQAPLMRSVGLDVEWRIISGSDEFFSVTKRIHNGLQGMALELTPEMRAIYLKTNRANAAALVSGYDFIVVHDPQPVPLRLLRASDAGLWIWRCHLDLTAAYPATWEYMRSFIEMYDAAIFTMPTYVRPDLRVGTVVALPPSIDPLSPKNTPLGADEAERLIRNRGVDPSRPLLVQVSRFDPWKDPCGVIDAYRRVKRAIPEVQLVLLGDMADDDNAEGLEYYQRTIKHAGEDHDLHVLVNTGGPREVNAFQQCASVVVQKSLREGFALTVTEGLWKAHPVVGGNAGGIPLQIQDGVTGYLVESVEQCAARVLDLLRDPACAHAMGARGREVVRANFVAPAQLRNYLALFNRLRGGT